VIPSSARVADNAAPAAPEGSSDSDVIKRKAYDLAALVAPENAYKQMTRILDVIEHVPRGDWLARMEMAGARIREMQAGHAIRNGDGIKHVLDILRE
jgi:hypothetical protein